MNISVVIPTLGERENIENCLGRLRTQLQNGDEVVIVDGGSSDGTVEFCKEVGCRVLLAENSSIGEARHIGTMEASNDVVASTDADALPPNDWISRIRSHFKNNDRLVVLWGTVEDKNGVPIRNISGKFVSLFRGASGNNTAFRKDIYEEMDSKYLDVDFGEDFDIINKLSKHGESVRDKNLVMVMDMDRSRYQTIPCVFVGASSYLLGDRIDNDILKGAGVGLAGTEFTYEGATNTPFHHDQVGSLVMTIARQSDRFKDIGTGLGGGMILHHAVTEGVSALPTEKQRNTDKVLE